MREGVCKVTPMVYSTVHGPRKKNQSIQHLNSNLYMQTEKGSN